jgi:ankyrin repeat protein
MRPQRAVRIDVLKSTRFGAVVVIAILLSAASGWTQDNVRTDFTAAAEVGAVKLDARPAPAKVTTEDETALVSKGYVKIGSVNASQDGTKTNPEITQVLNSVALARAAEAGGDVVRFEKEGAPTYVGKTKRKCTASEYVDEQRFVKTGQDCVHPDQPPSIHNACSDHYEWKTVSTKKCTNWEEVPVFGKQKQVGVESQGTVWRYGLAAERRAAAARAEAAAAFAAKRADRYGLRTAIEADDLAMMKWVLETDPALAHNALYEDGPTPLQLAAYRGNVEEVKLLVARGADVNNAEDSGGTTLLCGAGSKDVAEFLVAKGANVNAKDSGGKTPLLNAGYLGDLGLVELLLDKGADFNAKDNDGATVLHHAALHETGTRGVAEFLVAKGANVNARDNAGDTPLFRAAYSGNKEVVELLLDKGADVNAKNRFGDTPLHRAVYWAHKDVAELLLAKGADINARNDKRQTPLHCAASKGAKEMVQLLLAKAAYINFRDDEGKTP